MVDHEHGHDCPGIDKHIADVEEFISERMKDGLTIPEIVDIGGQVCSLVGCIVKQFRTDDLAKFDAFADGVERVWKAKVTPVDLPIHDWVEDTLVDPVLEQQVKPTLHLLRRSFTS